MPRYLGRASPAAVLALMIFLATACGGQPAHHPLGALMIGAKLATPPSAWEAYLSRLVEGTTQALSINKLPSQEDVLILFLDAQSDWRSLASSDARTRQIKGNCIAISQELTIACDMEFLLSFPQDASGHPVSEDAFAKWVLGHEIAHIALRDPSSHYLRPTQVAARSLANQRREYAADCWMLQRSFEILQPIEIDELRFLAVEFINNRMRTAQPATEPFPLGVGILFDYRRVDPYDFLSDDSHPDMILRATRLLHVLAQQTSDVGLNANLNELFRRLTPDPLWQQSGPCNF